MSKNNRNVLFLILIAVTLFAALSYAVTRSSSGNGSVLEESIGIQTSDLMQYASDLSYAVIKLTTVNKCDERELRVHITHHGQPLPSILTQHHQVINPVIYLNLMALVSFGKAQSRTGESPMLPNRRYVTWVIFL